MTDKLYTQSDMDRELSALRERCAKVLEIRANELRAAFHRQDVTAGAKASELKRTAIDIRALPITPHTEEG